MGIFGSTPAFMLAYIHVGPMKHISPGLGTQNAGADVSSEICSQPALHMPQPNPPPELSFPLPSLEGTLCSLGVLLALVNPAPAHASMQLVG